MLENITLADVSNLLQWAAGLAIAVGALYKGLKHWLNGMFKEQMENFDKQMKELSDKVDGVDKTLSDRIDKSDMESCKNFLVRCIADLERGEAMSETEKERFKEQFDHYKENNGNSYIKDKVERLKAEGAL